RDDHPVRPDRTGRLTRSNPSVVTAFSCQVHCEDGDPPTVYVIGEVDLSTRCRLAEALGQAGRPGHDLAVNCAKIVFIDIGGLSALLSAAEMVKPGRLRLVGACRHLAVLISLLDLTSTHPNLTVEP
ncbi:MAG: STAS domain-containing protein, partial [Micromonosporaceae bacterium]|nr:STAS domain-containing protein [Micromonosporaceae bacterium]